MINIDNDLIKGILWNADGLIPAIAQESRTGEVLMLAYMNAESLAATIESGFATYYSRSRQSLWRKGETSGHTQKVVSIALDCDSDALLMRVEQTGPACHTNEISCFHNPVADNGALPALNSGSSILQSVYDVIADRDVHPVAASYTNYLLLKGVEKICKKIGEEASETIIAAVKGAPDEVRYEVADLIYHLLVLLYKQGLTPDDIFAELTSRHRG